MAHSDWTISSKLLSAIFFLERRSFWIVSNKLSIYFWEIFNSISKISLWIFCEFVISNCASLRTLVNSCSYCLVSLSASAKISEALPRFVKIYSLRSSIIVNNGLYKITFNKTVNKTNWIATNGKVALKSNSPPGPL